MLSLLPIGSVLAKEDNKIIILGYQINPENNTVAYKCAPYPFGYINEDQNIYINPNGEFDIAFKGYETPQFQELMQLLEEIQNAYSEFGADEINNTIETIINDLNAKMNGEESKE